MMERVVMEVRMCDVKCLNRYTSAIQLKLSMFCIFLIFIQKPEQLQFFSIPTFFPMPVFEHERQYVPL